MSNPSLRDLELLSAYLDRELSQKEKTRLVARIVKDPDLARALDDLRQTRNMLRQTPKRKVPRNFTLTPKMAGIRPPVPRVVPALSWASAIAMLMFIFTLGYNFLTAGSLSAASPKAADNYGIAGAALATSAPATMAPAAPAGTLAPAIAPPATEVPTNVSGTEPGPGSVQRPKNTETPPLRSQQVAPPSPTATPEIVGLGGGSDTAEATATAQITSLALPTSEAFTNTNPSASSPSQAPRTIPWAYIWLGLAALFVITALVVRWLNRLGFRRRVKR